MGGVESSEDVNTYDFIQKADRKLYGEAKVCKKKDNKAQVIVKERYCDDQKIKHDFERYLDDNIWKSKHFTTLSATIVGSKGQYCGTCASS